MGLKPIRQTIVTEAVQEIDDYQYHVSNTRIDNVLMSINIRFFKEDLNQGSIECGNMNREESNTYINIVSSEDVFLHTGILADICKQVENQEPKKK